MSVLRSSDIYKKGINRDFDKKLSEYRNLRIWAGEAWKFALSEQESDIMVELWEKERETPWLTTVKEISTLMVFAARIKTWRKKVRREQSRVSMLKSREKMLAAAKNGDVRAKRKLQAMKNYERRNRKKYKEAQTRKRVETRVKVQKTKAYDTIKKYTTKLTLPQDVGHCAQELYKQIAETRSMTGKKNLTVCATVLYIAAKAGRNARPIRELCEILSVKRKQVSKCYSDIMKLRSEGKLNLRQQRSTGKRQAASATQEYAVRYANKLRLPGAIVTASRLIVKKVEEQALMTGRQPGTIAAACVYLASSLHPNKRHHRTYKEIGLMAQVSDVTIQNAYRKFILPNRGRVVDRSIQYASGVRPKKKGSLF